LTKGRRTHPVDAVPAMENSLEESRPADDNGSFLDDGGSSVSTSGRPADSGALERPSALLFVEGVRLLVVLAAIAIGFVGGGGSLARGVTPGEGKGPIIGSLLGALVGYIAGGVAGRFLRSTARRVERRIEGAATARLLAGGVGAVVCAGVGAIAAIPAPALVPYRLGWIIYALVVWVGAFFGYTVAAAKSEELFAVAGLSTRPLARASSYSHNLGSELTLIDASAAMDGRLLPLAQAGLLSGTVLVPVFVLDEIQAAADAQDAVRRRRGRRALDLLAALRTVPGVDVQVVEEAVLEQSSADAKLVSLAKRLRVGILTVDRALQRAAELQEVRCLNLDQLGELLRSIHIPGETLEVTITATGKEPGQGVGYLKDGSMVVVTDAADRIGQTLEVRVVNTTQTSVGTMIFAAIP